jgi:hypothetical protein
VVGVPAIPASTIADSPIGKSIVAHKEWRLIETRKLTFFSASFMLLLQNYPFHTLANQPEAAYRFAAAITGLDEAMTNYKSLRPIRDAAIAWLESCGTRC